MTTKTCIYNDQEYSFTGRIATKTTGRQSKRMYEIKPISADETDNSMNRWVKFEDVYMVDNRNLNEDDDDLGEDDD